MILNPTLRLCLGLLNQVFFSISKHQDRHGHCIDQMITLALYPMFCRPGVHGTEGTSDARRDWNAMIFLLAET